MALKFVSPAYTIAEKRSLFSKTLDGNRRLDIVARPVNPCIGDYPYVIEQAFKSVIMCVTDLRKEDLAIIGLLNRLSGELDSEDVQRGILNAILPMIIRPFPQLKQDGRTAYICPVISERGEGYRLGYVVAWQEEDALDVAAYMAGAWADIVLDLLDFNGGRLGGDFLGDLEYSNIDDDTDDYRRIVAGEMFRLAVEANLGIEAPEPEDPEFPGAELLETFTELS